MSSIVAIENAKLPSFIKPKAQVNNPFADLVGTRYKVLSLKSKVFTVVDGDQRKLLTADDGETPASSIEVVILAANPKKSRVYYKGGYEEGSTDKPDCYSNDGMAPAEDARNPQSKSCMTCPHSRYGSKITENGKKSFACTESKRIVIAHWQQLNDPVMLRVPAASLRALGAYGEDLAKRGIEPHHVVTQIKFDYTVSHPALLFKAVRFVTEDMYKEIEEIRKDEKIEIMTGVKSNTFTTEDELEPEQVQAVDPTPTPKQKTEAEAKPAPKPEPDVVTLDDLDFDD